MIPYGKQDISESDIQAVVDVLRSDFLTQGPMVPAFEQAAARRCGARHAVATSNATSALHLACLALGVGAGDLVWTSSITFVASANCALYCGAKVDFVDIDLRTYNMSVERLAAKLAQAERSGRLPKVLIPVHLCGQPCDMAFIRGLADHYGCRVIEDASHAIGAQYRDEPVGNCQYSDITVFSFHPVKIVTTGEGGMALTNNEELAKRMRLLRSHGVTRSPDELENTPDGPWYYEQVELGYNYRMTDIQAALGLSQMQRLDSFVAARRALARRYDELLGASKFVLPWQQPGGKSAFHLYVVRMGAAGAPVVRRKVFDALQSSGIAPNVHYIPVYLQPFYRRLGFAVGHCPEAEAYYSEAISLPMYPALTHEQQDHVVEAMRDAWPDLA
jgi:UDP-4-amino-4,6-dideoxy-N-acetyl-beta-L-altrosamine transaminase